MTQGTGQRGSAGRTFPNARRIWGPRFGQHLRDDRKALHEHGARYALERVYPDQARAVAEAFVAGYDAGSPLRAGRAR
jgi:hypothetical protein